MKIHHLAHSCLLVEEAGRRLLIDPGGFSGGAVRDLDAGLLGAIDAVLITHQHPDHVDPQLLIKVLVTSPHAVVLAEPETAAQLTAQDGPLPEQERGRVLTFAAGDSHEFEAVAGHPALTVRGVGGRHAIIHPDIPQVGNTGLVISTGQGPRLGVTGDSLEPLPDFHDIDVLAFAVVAPWSKMSETIDFLRAVQPRLALPVHDAIASDVGRPIFLRQSTNLAPAGTEVRDWPDGGLIEV